MNSRRYRFSSEPKKSLTRRQSQRPQAAVAHLERSAKLRRSEPNRLSYGMKSHFSLLPLLIAVPCLANSDAFRSTQFSYMPLSMSLQVGRERSGLITVPKEVEKRASKEFERRFGRVEGGFQLKERNGSYWIFSTRFGYAGLPGPDFLVEFQMQEKPNQASEPTAAAGRGSP